MRIKSLLIHIAIVIFLITNSTFVLAKQPTYQVLGNNINNDCSDGGSPYTLIFSSKPTLETVPFGKCTATAVYENGKRYGGDNFAFFIGSVVITRLPDKDDGNDDKDDNGDKNNNNDSGNSNNNNNDNKNSNSNNNNSPPPPTPTPSTPPPTPNPTPSKPPPTPDPTPSTPPPTPTPTPSKEADSCALLHPETETPGTLLQAANLLSSILPQTPDNMRLPTLISQMGGQGSLAGNLGLEIYSAAWQYLSIIAFIKFYKLIPGKMS